MNSISSGCAITASTRCGLGGRAAIGTPYRIFVCDTSIRSGTFLLQDLRSAQMWSCRAVLYLLFVVRFFARRAKKRTTDVMGSTISNGLIKNRRSLENLLGHLYPQQRAHILDLISDHRDGRSGEQQAHRDIVQRRHKRAGVAAGRHVGGDDLVDEATDAPTAIPHIYRRVHHRDSSGGVVGGAPGLLYDRPDCHVGFEPPTAHVADPVDLAVQVVKLPGGNRGIDQVAMERPWHWRIEGDRDEPAQGGNAIGWIDSTIEWPRLQDRVAG